MVKRKHCQEIVAGKSYILVTLSWHCSDIFY